jgi:hypothetical protein
MKGNGAYTRNGRRGGVKSAMSTSMRVEQYGSHLVQALPEGVRRKGRPLQAAPGPRALHAYLATLLPGYNRWQRG